VTAFGYSVEVVVVAPAFRCSGAPISRMSNVVQRFGGFRQLEAASAIHIRLQEGHPRFRKCLLRRNEGKPAERWLILSFEFALLFHELTYILHNNVRGVIVLKQC
jgi:hypothetical protein